MFLALIPAIWTACAFPQPDCASGYTRDGAGTCQARPEDRDTGDGAVLPGAYAGDFLITIVAEVAGAEIEDVCAGDVGIDQSEGVLSGVISCRFSGQVDVILSGETFSGVVDGQVHDAPAVSGSFSLVLGVFGQFSADWSGSATTESVAAEFSGETVFELASAGISVPVRYWGDFGALP